MTVRSSYQSRNFVISYYQRLNLGGEWLGDLDLSVQSWRHNIDAFGGFDSGEFQLVESQPVLEDWIANGLGRGIIVYDDTMVPIWEGFVNQISVNQAGLAVQHGPVNGIANRVRAVYSGVDTSVYPPIIGVRKQTPIFNNTNSQAIWGIWPVTLSLAGVTDSNADLLCAMYMKEHADAELSSTFSFDSGEISLSVSCLGWQHTLRYPYNFTTSSGDITITEKITAILDAQVNPGWISSDYSRIALNTVMVPRYDSDVREALELLKGHTAIGGPNQERHLFGIYEDRKAVYEQVVEQIDYEVRLTDPRQRILDTGGAVVPPWRIRPGKHVFFSDFLPGLGDVYADLHEDPRVLHVESIQYDLAVPFGVQITGGHNSKYEQKSAALGLRGTDV